MKHIIKQLKESQIEEFSKFIRLVFDEFVSIDYSAEGNATFYEYIEIKEIEKRFTQGNIFLIEENNNRIIGGIEIRNLNHICLLFVDKEFQNKGIAKALFKRALEYIREKDPNITFIEVNSSPYAKEIYKRMGFKEKSNLKETNGIKYYELVYEIKK